MRNRRRTTIAGGLALALVLTAAGCGDDGSGSDSAATTQAGGDGGGGAPAADEALPLGTTAGPDDEGEPAAGGRLVFGVEAEPEGLDPTRYAFSSSGHFVASAVFEPLATLDDNAEPVPYLAEAIEHNDDYTEWTITLPEGVTFHDGSPLDADAVVQNLNAYRESYITKAGLVDIEEVEATSDTEVTVTLGVSYAAFDAALTSQLGYIIAPAMLEDPSLVNSPIGTGPFVFDEHVDDESWTFTRNEDYRRDGLPYLDAVEYRVITDNVERQNALEQGDVDLMISRAPEVVEAVRQQDFKRVENGAGEEDFLILNTQAPPFDDLVARQAIVAATDSQAWLDEVGGDTVAPANGPFAPGQPGYLEDNGYPGHDLERAKQLVAQYEEETGEDFAITLVTQADTSVLVESQLFEDMWEEAGIDVEVEALPQINLIAQIATANFEVGRFRLYNQPNADVDANTFWRSSGVLPPPDISLNFARFESDVVDEAVANAVATTDEAVRDEEYQKVNREFAEQLPYIWLGRPTWMLAAEPRVNGIYAGANGTVQTIGAKTWLSEIWLSQ